MTRARELPLQDRAAKDVPQHQTFFTGLLRTFLAPGLVGARSARIAGRTLWSTEHGARIVPAGGGPAIHHAFEPNEDLVRSDGTFSFDLESGLEPDTEYSVEVFTRDDDAKIAEGSFRTAPPPDRTTGRVTFGLLSCNNPFDDEGELDRDALRVLSFARDVMRREGVARLLLMGDQIYGDLPEPLSLFDDRFFSLVGPQGRSSLFECSEQQVRSLYQERHRIFWKTRAFRDLQAAFASHPILDDHEVIDNFGSDPAHATTRWANVKQGALAAFHDYQGRRVFGASRPKSFDHGFRYGPVAGYVLDLRSERVASSEAVEIFREPQRARLTRFLEGNADAAVLVLVLSVPILHVPDWMATVSAKIAGEGSDAGDRWSCQRAQASRDRLLATLSAHARAHPHQRLIIAGGDIHVGAAMRFRLEEAGRDAYQLVSSAITNRQGRLHEIAAEALPQMQSVMGGRRDVLARAEIIDGDHNPYGGLNFGLLDVEAREGGAGVRLRLIGADDEVIPGPVTVFDSGWL